jgi:hypothetical protein
MKLQIFVCLVLCFTSTAVFGGDRKLSYGLHTTYKPTAGDSSGGLVEVKYSVTNNLDRVVHIFVVPVKNGINGFGEQHQFVKPGAVIKGSFIKKPAESEDAFIFYQVP